MNETSRLDLKWQGGGTGRVVGLEGDNVQIQSDRPFAPGARPHGTLTGGYALRVKVHRSRKIAEAPAAWVVEGRMLEARRDLLTALSSRLSPATPAGDDPTAG